MKTKLFFVAMIIGLSLQNCQDSNLPEKPAIDKVQLQKVLSTSEYFKKLILLHEDFSNELSANYAALPEEEKTSLTLKSSLTKSAAVALGQAYDELVDNLNSKYNFKIEDLKELIIEEVNNMKSKNSKLKCDTICSNESERVYWVYYKGLKDVDRAAAFADQAYASCMRGCAPQIF